MNENSLREFAQNTERIIPLCISFRSVAWRQECCSKILQAPTFEENLLAKRYVGQLGSSPSSGEFTRTKNSLWLCQNSYWKYPIYSWFTYSKWWSSIVMLVYQRVRGKVEVNPHWVVQYDAASFNQNWEVNILGAETRQPDMAWEAAMMISNDDCSLWKITSFNRSIIYQWALFIHFPLQQITRGEAIAAGCPSSSFIVG